jgi:hypothetical protein
MLRHQRFLVRVFLPSSTYSPVVHGSGRWWLDLVLSLLFAADYLHRTLVGATSWIQPAHSQLLVHSPSLYQHIDYVTAALPPLAAACTQQLMAAAIKGTATAVASPQAAQDEALWGHVRTKYRLIFLLGV